MINVDYPRLGADAVGRPVEQTVAMLVKAADEGESEARSRAILTLSHYSGFPLQSDFSRWLLVPDDHVSRAAALALVTARPQTAASVFATALFAKNASTRKNAAWALGVIGAPAKMLMPLLKDDDPHVLEETLIALSHMPGHVSAEALLPSLSSHDPAVRGAAALALAAHQPAVAATAVTSQLRNDSRAAIALYDAWIQGGKKPLTPNEIDRIVAYYRCQVKEVQGLSLLHGPAASEALKEQAFRPGKNFADMDGIMAAFQLWDRIGADPRPAVTALSAADSSVADRAEWMLIKSGPSALPFVHETLMSQNASARVRAIRIVAWQGDVGALPELHRIQAAESEDTNLASWAIQKIEMLHPKD